MMNHLLACELCPDVIKAKLRKEKFSDEDGEDSAANSEVSSGSKRKQPDTSNRTDSRQHKQAKFNVTAAKFQSFTTQRQIGFEDQLLRAVISAGWSFNSMEDPEVKKLFAEYMPGGIVPNRQALSERILTREVTRVEGDIKAGAAGAPATLQCDGWKDNSKKHLVAFMFTEKREVRYIHSDDLRLF